MAAMEGFLIKANEIQLIPIKDIKLNSANRNKHPKEQIDRLCKIIAYQGFRQPLIVSARSGLVVAGHGRYEAAKRLKFKVLPVMVQEFDSEEQEYAAHVSDNAISHWAELDVPGINLDMVDLGPDFDLDHLGLKDFTLDPSEKIDTKKNQKPKEHECPNCNEIFECGKY